MVSTLVSVLDFGAQLTRFLVTGLTTPWSNGLQIGALVSWRYDLRDHLVEAYLPSHQNHIPKVSNEDQALDFVCDRSPPRHWSCNGQGILAPGAKKVYAGVLDMASFKVPRITPIQFDVTNESWVAAGSAQSSDVSLLIINAGIAGLIESTLDASMLTDAREFFEANFYGLISTMQTFATVRAWNGGGVVIFLLSDTRWVARPQLCICDNEVSTWSFTIALRQEVRSKA